ncbi:MAG TPA: DNA repair protein RecN [Anaerovoracaceae bacterium]|nr:DNA repair protein RecN [Anaerovoracaceae bacterium]
MINRIEIENFATISKTSIDLENGLNIITGETGAGKSVLVQAISIALGARADTTYVRTGEDKAIIQLAGNLSGNEVIISREIYSSGKSISKINGSLVTLNNLREFCEGYADIHGQYDNQSLLEPNNHINILDKFNNQVFFHELNELKLDYDEYLNLNNQYQSLLNKEKESLSKKDYYEFELSYIDNLKLIEKEDTELADRINMLSNSEKIYSSVSKSYVDLHEKDQSILSEIKNIESSLNNLRNYSNELNELADSLNDIYFNLEDISSKLRNISESINYSEDEINELSERLSLIEDAKRKYKKSITEILEYRDKINDELTLIDNFDDEKTKLFDLKESSFNKAMERANKLSQMRKKVATYLEVEMSKQLKDLNFQNTEFKVNFTKEVLTKNGFDKIEFLISTNPGDPLKPLAKIASGGEISRVMLALKGILRNQILVPTMIFDEIDTGISGITASIVGKKLMDLSINHQIICITHLPQIAAYGNTNYTIIKENIDNKSHTIVKRLNNVEKVNDIARLLGGMNITETTKNSAIELINTAN